MYLCKQYNSVKYFLALAAAFLPSILSKILGGNAKFEWKTETVSVLLTGGLATLFIFNGFGVKSLDCPCNDCTSKEIAQQKFNEVEGVVKFIKKREDSIIRTTTNETVKTKIEATQEYRERMIKRTTLLINDSLTKNCDNKDLILHIERNIESIKETTQPNY